MLAYIPVLAVFRLKNRHSTHGRVRGFRGSLSKTAFYFATMLVAIRAGFAVSPEKPLFFGVPTLIQ